MHEFKNTLLYLIGFPGTGKYTIAKEICAQADFILCDNHLVNNCLFPLVRASDKKPLPEGLWDNIEKVWGAVFDTIINIADKNNSYIMTNHLADEEEDYLHYDNIKDVAHQKNGVFVPVILRCDLDALLDRGATPERAQRHKITNTDYLRQKIEKDKMIKIEHPNLLELDVTSLSPSTSAKVILDHLSTLYQKQKAS